VLLSALPNARAGLPQFVCAPSLTWSFVSRQTPEHGRFFWYCAERTDPAQYLQSRIQLFDSVLRLISFFPQLLDHVSQVRH